MSYAELARAAQGGNAASLGILLERYQASLRVLALRMLGHGPHAEESVQDTLLIALRSVDGLREPEAVGGWLHGVLRTVCSRLSQVKVKLADALRRRPGSSTTKLESSRSPEVPSPSPGPASTTGERAMSKHRNSAAPSRNGGSE